MNVLVRSRDFSKVEEYKLTRGDSININSLPDGQPLEVLDFIIYEDDNKKFGQVKVLSISTPDGIYSTISQTFIDEFEFIHTLMDGERYTIYKKSGVSKSNQDFVSCTL